MQAWLEVVMAMPMYIRSCSENVKSGKVGCSQRRDAGGAMWGSSACHCLVHYSDLCDILQVLLGLTDEDLELGLGVSSLMHRRKLRLAIEDYRDAEKGGG